MLQPLLNSVTPLENNQLKLEYETGETKIFDVTPYICGSFMGKLSDKNYFNRVKLVDNRNGVEWPEGQDIAPHELYDYGKNI